MTVANMLRGKRARARRLEDFLLRFGRKPRQSWQEQLAIVEAINRQLGGADLRKDRNNGHSRQPAGQTRR